VVNSVDGDDRTTLSVSVSDPVVDSAFSVVAVHNIADTE